MAEVEIYINDKRFYWTHGKIIVGDLYDIISKASYNKTSSTNYPASQKQF